MGRHIIPVLVVLIAIASVSRGQTEDAATKLRIAQSLERSGDWERAVPIYESLLLADPQNFVYYDALRRGYIQLKQYEKAVDLIQYRQSLQPDNPLHRSALGGVYYQMGKEELADSVWQALIRMNASNIGMYRLIANQMMEYRLYDRAIALFQQARNATGDQNLFTAELANLYGAFQQYENAAREFLRLLIQQPQQIADIQSRMSVFLSRPEALQAAARVAKETVEQRREFIPARQLYAWILMEDRSYPRAFEQYRIIDRTSKARGVELLGFAQRALEGGEFETAVRAFKEVLETPPPSELIPVARLGYAKAMESGAEQDSGKGQEGSPPRPSVSTALEVYETIIREYPGSPHAAEALFRIGMVRSERLRDLDGALSAFARIPGIMPESRLAQESVLESGRVLTEKNDLEAAQARYGSLLRSKDNTLRERVLFRLAELDYFKADFDTSISTLRLLSASPGTDLTNDALKLRYFIEENSATAPHALQRFAAAELLMRQHRYPEALEGFRSILREHPSALLIDVSMLHIADLLLRLGRPSEAIEALESVIDEMTMSIHRDKALVTIASIQEHRLRNTAAALKSYERLLALFPSSIYAEEARRRIRVLRGDAS